MGAKKICALMRQTWYEAAKKNLKPEERVRFYEMCFEFEFFGHEPEPDAPFAAKLLFDMVHDELESDRERAAERSERNRLNGAGGGRPKKVTEQNIGDYNPQKPTGFFGNPNTKQNKTKQDKTEQRETEDAHTFFSVCLNFFERGTSNPVGEARTFWNYYAAMGWKTKSGGEIVDRLALANAWRLPDCSKSLIRKRMGYADLMHKADPVEVCLIEDFVEFKRSANDKVVEIVFAEKGANVILDTKYTAALRQWVPIDNDGKYYQLTYRVLHQTLD